jgi:hypothetical protein
MEYEQITIDTQKHIIINSGDGSFKSFPADESNPEYIEFLAQLNKEDK